MHKKLQPNKGDAKQRMEIQKIKTPIWKLPFMYIYDSLHMHFRGGAKTCMVSSNNSFSHQTVSSEQRRMSKHQHANILTYVYLGFLANSAL